MSCISEIAIDLFNKLCTCCKIFGLRLWLFYFIFLHECNAYKISFSEAKISYGQVSSKDVRGHFFEPQELPVIYVHPDSLLNRFSCTIVPY